MWPAEHLLYQQHLAAVALAQHALRVPVFTGQPFVGDAGLRVAVTMPSAHQLAGAARLELDFTLGCPGPRDTDCPLWVRAPCPHGHGRGAAAPTGALAPAL